MKCLHPDGRDSFLADDELRRNHFIAECELAGFICTLLDFVELACKHDESLCAEGKGLLDSGAHPGHPIMHLADFLRRQSW
jgi:hypothetical protein